MTERELRATGSLAAIYSVRLLGLFMIYPVFADYARLLSGATPYKIGLALGIYGLSQGLLQIPFGLFSDRIGRKPMIAIGLVLFGAGSAVAALSTSIDGVIIGRLIQGGGAIGSVVLALIADLTAEQNRTKAMAIVGITIGTSFMLALITGPIIGAWIGVQGIFWLMVGLAAVGIGIAKFVVPEPGQPASHPEAEPVVAMLTGVLRNRDLLRLDFSIFALQAMLTASFLVVPGLLHGTLKVTSRGQWIVYLPVLLASAVIMVPAIIAAERHGRMKQILMLAVAGMGISLVALALNSSTYVLVAAMVVFFAGINILEATLPSLVTKTAPQSAKGSATGIFSSSQFLGTFAGGVIGGKLQQASGSASVLIASGVLALIWLIVIATMVPPKPSARR